MNTLHTTWTEIHGGRKVNYRMATDYGLRYIKGNSQPYFSVTCTGWESGRESFAGSCHDIILEQHPELVDIIALHCSAMDGSPMHAEANGWYWLAKAAGIPQRWEPETPPAECRTIFAKHCRITEERAQELVELVQIGNTPEISRQAWQVACDAMRGRWLNEAWACIAKHGLVVSGDVWPPIPEAAEALALAE